MDFSSSISAAREISIEEYRTQMPLGSAVTNRQVLEMPSIRKLQSGEKMINDVTFEVQQRAQWVDSILQQEFERLVNKQVQFGWTFRLAAKLSGLAIQLGKTDEAIRFIRHALDLREDRSLRFELAELLRQKGEREEASRILSGLNDVDFEPAILKLAELKVYERDLESAKANVMRALTLAPNSWRANLLSGTISLFRGELDSAIRELRKTLNERGNLSNAYTFLAFAHYMKGEMRHVFRDLRAAIAINPLNDAAVLGLADISDSHKYATQFVEESLKFYVRFSENNKAGLERLGRFYYLAKTEKQGIDALSDIADKDKTSSVWNNLGVLYMELADYRQAVKCLKESLKLSASFKDSEIPVVNLAQTFSEERKWGDAGELLTRWIESVGLVSALSGKYGHIIASILIKSFLLDEKFEAAKDWANRVELHCDEPKVLCAVKTLLGIDYVLRQRDFKKAIEYTKEAYELTAYFTDKEVERRTINNLAFVLLEAGDVEAGGEMIREFNGNYQNPFEMATAGLWHMRSGHLARGEELYRKAVAGLRRTSVRRLVEQKMWLEIGRYQIEHGEFNKAERALSKALKVSGAGFDRAIKTFHDEAQDLLRIARKNKLKD